jgi:DNA-binding CsgD family transcriptional regulator
MQLPLAIVEETRVLIEEKLRSAKRTLSSRRIEMVSLSALSTDDGDDEKPLVAELRASDISPEVRAEAVGYWSRLPVKDRTILRLVVEGNSAKDVAGVLDLTPGEVYNAIYRIRREMPEWFKM